MRNNNRENKTRNIQSDDGDCLCSERFATRNFQMTCNSAEDNLTARILGQGRRWLLTAEKCGLKFTAQTIRPFSFKAQQSPTQGFRNQMDGLSLNSHQGRQCWLRREATLPRKYEQQRNEWTGHGCISLRNEWYASQ